jgi:hypothetical protein
LSAARRRQQYERAWRRACFPLEAAGGLQKLAPWTGWRAVAIRHRATDLAVRSVSHDERQVTMVTRLRRLLTSLVAAIRSAPSVPIEPVRHYEDEPDVDPFKPTPS